MKNSKQNSSKKRKKEIVVYSKRQKIKIVKLKRFPVQRSWYGFGVVIDH